MRYAEHFHGKYRGLRQAQQPCFDKLSTGRFGRLSTGCFDKLSTGRFDRLSTGRFGRLSDRAYN
jgi:hypothetical protein